MLLSGHFAAADVAARKTREGYKRAAGGLNRRVWAGFIHVQLAIIVTAAFSVYFFAPSLDEIQARRITLAQLQGVTEVHWGNCNVNGKVTRCLRTDETAGNSTAEDGSSWHVPWHK